MPNYPTSDKLKDCMDMTSFYHNKIKNKNGKYDNKKEYITLFNLNNKKNKIKYELYQCNFNNPTKGKLLLCYSKFANLMENLHCIDDEISKETYISKKNNIKSEIKDLEKILSKCRGE